jgi:hypothetical protein
MIQVSLTPVVKRATLLGRRARLCYQRIMKSNRMRRSRVTGGPPIDSKINRNSRQISVSIPYHQQEVPNV